MKRFRAKVSWFAFWRHRWTILHLLNQVAHGSVNDAIRTAGLYGGAPTFGAELKRAADAVIRVRGEEG